MISPFADLARPVKGKGPALVAKRIPPSPAKKIQRIREYAERATMPEIGAALAQIHFADIRNAVFHADYTLTTEFRMMKGRYTSSQGYLSPVVPLGQLNVLINRALAFYSALLGRYQWARRAFVSFKDKAIPYDFHYKGLLELLFENDMLSGLRVYWPNGSCSEFSRTSKGCYAQNLRYEPDGSLNFMVGLYASKPGPFSPLVESDQDAVYVTVAGRSKAPYWPLEPTPISLV